ncbi:RNA polymerase sigma factor [Parapedobacter lycopersici]|uniref:RNA polymerase sigma factor n=1 Tax=Parapedobacter lycopersici TaxID=1864939 RepID=UPI00214DD4D2|nr:sigma-70 family RNA polymerase sigma factor [Parapedobacter lycopersici]
METATRTYLMSDEKQHHISTAVKSYGRVLLGFIRKRVASDADAEDVLQDVWFQLSSIINSQPVEQLGAWLYRVARNKIIDRHRKKKEHTWPARTDDDPALLEIADAPAATDGNPETEYQERMMWQQLYLALDELPSEQRDVFIWHALDGIPFAEIAELTGEPITKLVMRKRYAVLHLRQRMKVFYDELTDH